MEIGSLFVGRVNGSGQTLAFHEGQVLRGVVLNRFADSGLVQIQLKDTRVVAELKADLMVGKTYWFTVQKDNLCQSCKKRQKAIHMNSFSRHGIECLHTAMSVCLHCWIQPDCL